MRVETRASKLCDFFFDILFHPQEYRRTLTYRQSRVEKWLSTAFCEFIGNNDN
jgi:hypothetical protein